MSAFAVILIRSGLIAVLTLAALAAATAQAPPEHYARLPAAQGVSISPDGERIAFIGHREHHRLLVVRDLTTGEQMIADASHLRAFGTFWANDDTILARVGRLFNVLYVRGDVGFETFLTIDANTMQSEQLIRTRAGDGANFNTSRIAGVERSTGRLLMPLWDDDGRLNLYAVNPENGSERRVRARGTRNTRYWIADPNGERFARIAYSDRQDVLQVDLRGADENRRLMEVGGELITMGFQGFSEDGDSLLVSGFANEPPFTRQLRHVSLETGEIGDTVFSDPHYDFDEVLIDPHRGHVAGVSIERERREAIWFDQELASRQTSLEAAFPGSVVTLIDWTPDRTRFVVRTDTQAQPSVFYLVDFTSGGAAPINLTYPELYTIPQTARRLISYPAADGAHIPAYLAVPNGEGPHPFVVLVHGGPAARDFGGFDYLAHFLTSRGYGVIQPQFRGSRGFGTDWEAAGHGGWGLGVMQTDVNDAASYLNDNGLAEQICIAGASYGGYAALAGAAFMPDLYDCAISINGVSDLPHFLRYVHDRYGLNSQALRYWNNSISGDGVQAVDRELLLSLSPHQHAESISVPILLIHGEDDTVVPFRQARIMQRAMRRAGADPELVALDGGDHWLLEYQTRLDVLRAVERFLAEHLGHPDG